MIEGWRWFAPDDKITLPEVAQTGASAIVSALHEVPYGKVWTVEAIRARQALIADADVGLSWQVVESLPLHEDIKLGVASAEIFANYRQSLANLATCGITTICYNFMPLLDWTRTTLHAPVFGGGTALRFDAVEMAAFELHMLQRPGAEADYPSDVVAGAATWAATATEATKDRLLASIMSGLPGAFDRYTIDTLRDALARYRGIDRASLRANYARVLAEALDRIPGFSLAEPVETNMLFLAIEGATLPALTQHLADHGIKISGARWVLHKDISPENLQTLIKACEAFAAARG